MQAIFNFLDGCGYEFSEIENYEAEMAQYDEYL